MADETTSKMKPSSSLVSTDRTTENPTFSRWFLGMLMASVFSISYLVIPFYAISSILALVFQYPTSRASVLIAAPLILSVFSKPTPSPYVLRLLAPMLDYFQFESITEDEKHLRDTIASGTKYIFACQPHGVLSFCGMCSAISVTTDVQSVPTAAASVVLSMPLLKNLMGIFNLIDASSGSIRRNFKKGGMGGCVVIYIGGIAELFKSCRTEERLYLSKRKGFIKMALREGVDVVPVYLFGNTSVLSVLKHGPLAALSRKLQVSLTWLWGMWYLPIPRDDKLLYVCGKPLGLPHIAEPTQEDIDKWHAKYCEEVRRLFESYKEKVPLYKHKKLFID